MGDDKSGASEAVKGAVEGVKGKAKEMGGALTGQNDMVREGEAQQDKADAQRDVAKK
ncbi:MAG: CsbD family protein, partial [Mycobacterium sp.]|nr:CsbD family protein [Mycobacterium sp.]